MMVSHIYRQGNSIADRLASHAYSHRSYSIFEAASSLPGGCKQAYYNDKEGLYSYSCSWNAFFHQSHVRNRKRTTKGLSILGVILTRK